MCNHELQDLMGVAGGVICRKCGMRFDHIPKQNEATKAEVKADEEKPVKKTPARKPAAKKGAKA